MSIRIDENRAKTEKLLPKHGSRGLIVRVLGRIGAPGEETEG